MIITQTPFRMSFFGGGTDMESFFRENGGAVLSTTFDKYCYGSVQNGSSNAAGWTNISIKPTPSKIRRAK